jgi:5-methylcytosine-specific restriction endonuclease McrA
MQVRQTRPKRPPGITRRSVLRLYQRGLTQREIASRLGLTKSTVAFHIRRIGIEPDERFARRYDWDGIQRAYDTGLSVRECARRFGFNLASWHQAKQRGDVVARPRAMPIKNLLVIGRRTSRHHLKRRLLAEGLKENRCEQCGISDWQGKPLNMQLHHLNGNGTDNRLENIVFLCGNCHSQTDTYGGRNGHRRTLRSAANFAGVEVGGDS